MSYTSYRTTYVYLFIEILLKKKWIQVGLELNLAALLFYLNRYNIHQNQLYQEKINQTVKQNLPK